MFIKWSVTITAVGAIMTLPPGMFRMKPRSEDDVSEGHYADSQ